jgi:PAS domain-containing protein
VLVFIHPDFRDAIRKNIENDLSGGTSPPIELHMLRVDGTLIIVEGRGVITSIDGKPAVQVAIRDITERKRVEEILQRTKNSTGAWFKLPGPGMFSLTKRAGLLQQTRNMSGLPAGQRLLK